MNDWNTIVGAGLMLTTAIFSAEWIFIAWLSRQFAKVYAKMDELVEKILNKLEYHERHDDKRFADITDNLTEIRISNASRDSILKWLSKRPESFPLSATKGES